MSVHWERPEVTGRRSERREQPLTDVGRWHLLQADAIVIVLGHVCVHPLSE